MASYKVVMYAALAVVVFICVVSVLVVFFITSRRNNAKSDVEIMENTDVSKFDRLDINTFLDDLDDIQSDMLIMDGYRRFIAVISCTGFDFFSSSAKGQYITLEAYQRFIRSIEGPFTYRQYSQVVDLEPNLKMYDEAITKRQEELYLLDLEYANLCKLLEEVRDTDDELVVLEQMEELQNKMSSCSWRISHLEQQVAVLNNMSGGKTEPDGCETYVFEHCIDNPGAMTNEERVVKASKELDIKVRNYMAALSSAKVQSYRVGTEELIYMNRRHFHPLTADVYKYSDVKNSSFFDDVISSNNLGKAKDLALEEERYEAGVVFDLDMANEENLDGVSDNSGSDDSGNQTNSDEVLICDFLD